MREMAKSEIINDSNEYCINDPASSVVLEQNGSGTNKKIDTPLTQQCSGDVPMTDLPKTTTVLKKLRSKHGYKSEIGRRCSNILEIMDGMTRPPEEWIDYLMPDWVPVKYAANVDSIARQTADLHRLLAA